MLYIRKVKYLIKINIHSKFLNSLIEIITNITKLFQKNTNLLTEHKKINCNKIANNLSELKFYVTVKRVFEKFCSLLFVHRRTIVQKKGGNDKQQHEKIYNKNVLKERI